MTTLDESDAEILRIAARHLAFDHFSWAHLAGRGGVPNVAWFQRLNRLIDTRAALEADPVTVNRLRRLRDHYRRRTV